MNTRAKTSTSQRLIEAGLLQEVARGDVEAMRSLYRAFERPLYTLGIRWLGDPALAEELVQEVTLRIWRRAGNFDPQRGAAGSWIFGVARNVASDLARARGRRPIPVENPPVTTKEPWNEEAAWTAWQVAQAVATLPHEQQKILQLAYTHQFTQSEIAKALKMPLGTVKTRLYRALKDLRVKLSDMDVELEERG